MNKSKQLYYLEPDMVDKGSHLYNTLMAFKQGLLSLCYDDLSVTYILSDCCDESIIKNLNAKTIYRNYQPISYKNKIFFLIRELRFIARNFIAFCKIGNLDENNEKYIYFNTAQSYHLFAAYFYLLFFGRKIKKFIFTLRLSTYSTKTKKSKRYVMYYISITLLKFFGCKVAYVTDSELLKEEYAREFGIDAAVLCIPHVPESSTKSSSVGAETIGFLGGTRTGKNSVACAHAIKLLDQNCLYPDNLLKIIFHTFGENQREVQEILSDVKNIKIELREYPLSEDEYYSDLDECTSVFLGYSAGTYHSATSGIFFEGACLGKHLLVGADTWMHHQCDKHGIGQIIPQNELNSNGIAEAIISYLQDPKKFTQNSVDAARLLRACNSPRIFTEQVLSKII